MRQEGKPWVIGAIRPPKPVRPPRWLSALARAEWRRVIRVLPALDLRHGVGYSWLVMYCEAIADWRTFANLAQQPAPPEDVEMFRREAERQQRTARKLARGLGLTPDGQAPARRRIRKTRLKGKQRKRPRPELRIGPKDE